MPVDKYRDKEYGVRKMNERIKELAVIAKVEHCVSHVRLQEFAELIVRECAALAKSKSEHIEGIKTKDPNDKLLLHSLAWQFKEFSYVIEKHFGVE
jgi:predicted transposase YbfD/YdcC